MTYTIHSLKLAGHPRTVEGSLAEAIAAAKEYDREHQPAFGTQVENGEGETVWNSEDRSCAGCGERHPVAEMTRDSRAGLMCPGCAADVRDEA